MNNTWFPIKFAPTDRDIKLIVLNQDAEPILVGSVHVFNTDNDLNSMWQPLDNMCPFCLERQIKYKDVHFCDECDNLFNSIMDYHLNHTVTIQDSINLLAPYLDPKKKEFIAYWWTA